jgi:hypothetical protein
MRIGLGIARLKMLFLGQFSFPFFVPPYLELGDEDDELVDEDLPFRFVELLLVLVDASQSHYAQPILTAKLFEKPIYMLFLMLCAISLNISQLFLLAFELAVCAEIQVLVQRVNAR